MAIFGSLDTVRAQTTAQPKLQKALDYVQKLSRLDSPERARLFALPVGESVALLAPDDVLATHRFIRVCENSRVADAAYRHITVHDGRQLLAIASCCRMQVALDLLSTGVVRGAIQGVRRWRREFLRVPVAFCGLPVSFGQSCVRLRPGTDAPAIAVLVAQELDRKSVV